MHVVKFPMFFFSMCWNDEYESTCCENLNVTDDKWTFVAEMNGERSAFQYGGYMVVRVSMLVKSIKYYDAVTDK